MPDGTPPPDAERVAHAERVMREAAPALFAIPGVMYVALGGKEVGGDYTGELVIRVHVAYKRPAGEVPAAELIPAEIGGVRTDVVVTGEMRPITAPPGGLVRSPDTDDQTKRPVRGGLRLMTAGASNSGTLGCLLWLTTNHDVGYALTNQHVIDASGSRTVTKGSTEVGQPSGEDSSCCSNDIIGVYAEGQKTPASDQAVVRLSPGLKWLAEILEIGPVAGSRPVTANDAVARTPVRKRGARTRLTGGVVTDFGVDPAGNRVILVTANDNPDRQPGELLFVADEGDSGSALVDNDRKVVGLLFFREFTRAERAARGLPVPPLPPDGIERPRARLWSIEDVLARFAASTPPLALEVATATAPNQVHTVPSAAALAAVRVPAELVATVRAEPGTFLGVAASGELRAPVGGPWFASDQPVTEAVAEMRARLGRSDAGRLLLDLQERHRDEVTRLLRGDRRVLVTWHRGGGAALFQLLLRMLDRPELELPATVYGMPVAEVLDRLVAALGERGSPALGADLRRARAVLPDPAGRTLPEILVALAAAPVAVGGDA